jgi:GNAT superfamily N-acetyltransferase
MIMLGGAERRRGVGTRLLEAAVDAAKAERRRSVIAQTVQGSPADLFLPARGFRQVLTLIHARLASADVDRAGIDTLVELPHPGYRLTEWEGTVPDAPAQSFAHSRRAMDDMPMEGPDFGRVVWGVERVVAATEAVARRGELLHAVAAVDASDGSAAGFSELVVPGDGSGDGQHYGTAILPEHRARGLARWMKAASIRHALQRQPELAGLRTDTAESNVPMLAVDNALGYVATHRAVEYQLDL